MQLGLGDPNNGGPVPREIFSESELNALKLFCELKDKYEGL